MVKEIWLGLFERPGVKGILAEVRKQERQWLSGPGAGAAAADGHVLVWAHGVSGEYLKHLAKTRMRVEEH